MEDVHDALSDVVELIMTHKSKNRLSRVLMSTLFKQRQDELDAVVDRAILRLHVSGKVPRMHVSGVNLVIVVTQPMSLGREMCFRRTQVHLTRELRF